MTASDFVMMDIDSDTETVVGLQPEQTHRHIYYIPKLMEEMAEEHAARQVGSEADDDFDDGEDETVASQKRATVKITLPSKASVSTPNNLSSNRSTKAKINRRSSWIHDSKIEKKTKELEEKGGRGV